MEVYCNYPGSPEVGGYVYYENHTVYATPNRKYIGGGYIIHTSPANLTIFNCNFIYGQDIVHVSAMLRLWKIFPICNPHDEVLEIMNVSNNKFISPGNTLQSAEIYTINDYA